MGATAWAKVYKTGLDVVVLALSEVAAAERAAGRSKLGAGESDEGLGEV